MKSNYFQEWVATELTRARSEHPALQTTLHEGYAVLLEEVDEVWDLVKSKRPDPTNLLKELIQVAAMAQRFAEDQLI